MLRLPYSLLMAAQKEDLYTCAWTLFTSGPLSGTAVLAAAGLLGAINLINVAAGATHKVPRAQQRMHSLAGSMAHCREPAGARRPRRPRQ